MIGTILSDRYHITDILSSGGMSETYIAEDTQRPGNPNCVVKRLKPSINESEELDTTRQLFNQEAAALEQLGLNDPIPRLLAYFEHEHEFYLIQELIEGHSLKDEMPLGIAWSEADVLTFLSETLSILETVHNHHVIHRDIKPANILRRKSDNKLVLIDFGAVKRVHLQRPLDLAKIGMSQTTATVVIGTPGYMPSEQALGKPKQSSDIYALGITAIQALTGLVPSQLREDEDGELIWRSHIEGEISDRLATVLTKMVRRFHKQRYQTATDALVAVQQIALNNSSYQTTPQPQQSTNKPILAEPEEKSSSMPPNNVASKSHPDTSTSPQSPPSNPTPNPFPSSEPSRSEQQTVRMGQKTYPNQKHTSSTPSQPSRFNFQQKQLWQLGCAVLAGGLLMGAGYGFFRYDLQQRQDTRLKELTDLQQDKRNKTCMDRTLEFMTDFPADKFLESHDAAIEIGTKCAEQQFAEAQAEANKYSFIKAVEIAQTIPEEIHSVYQQIQAEIPNWYSSILNLAKEQYHKHCNLSTATKWASEIPSESSIRQKAQSAIATWEQEDKANKSRLERADKAIAEQDWQAAQAARDELTMLGQPISSEENCLSARIQGIEGGIKTIKEKHNAETRVGILQEEIPVLNKSGVLLSAGEPGVTRLREDDTLYKDYFVDGDQGDTWRIRLTSEEFDTRVFLIDPNSNVIAENDDTGSWAETDYDSLIETHTLPMSGRYRIRVNSYEPYEEGHYDLLVDRLRS